MRPVAPLLMTVIVPDGFLAGWIGARGRGGGGWGPGGKMEAETGIAGRRGRGGGRGAS